MIVVRPDIDDQELAAAVAAARAADADVDPLEARRRSRAALRRWSRRPIPPGLDFANDVELLVERHRSDWLGSASAAVRSLDPAGLGRGSVHAVDLCDLGVDLDSLLGLTGPGLFHLARRLLPVSAVPGPAMALNLREHVRYAAADDDTLAEPALVHAVRLAVTATAIHEAGHAIELALTGDDVLDEQAVRDLESVPLEDVRRVFGAGVTARDTPARRAATHGPAWLRAAAHLTYRSTRRPGGDFFVRWYLWEARTLLGPRGDDVLDALVPELVTTSDEPIVDILRRDPPTSFARLLDERVAA